MEQPLISVIVPVYKVEPYLDKCVSSIANQTYTNLEIILVDDGSPDNCPAMCDAWAARDSRIRVIHKENGGLSDARNAGMAAAAGELMAFVDGDDWIDVHFIEYLHAALRKINADIAACELCKAYDDGAVSAVPAHMPQAEAATSEQAIEDVMHNRRFRAVAWNKLYKRDILAGERFEVGRLHEDEFFTYRMYDKATRLAYIAVPLYNYRQRTGSIVSSFSLRRLDALDAFLARLALLESKYPRLVPEDKRNFCVACLNFYSYVSAADSAQRREAKLRIKNRRRQVCFSPAELRKYPLKDKIYIVLSDSRIIGIGCRLRELRGGVRKWLHCTQESQNVAE